LGNVVGAKKLRSHLRNNPPHVKNFRIYTGRQDGIVRIRTFPRKFITSGAACLHPPGHFVSKDQRLLTMGIKINGLAKTTVMIGTLLFLVGCASEPVPVQWPANHPANPDAAQAVYRPAIDPFQDTGSMHEMKSTEGAPMPHEGHMDRQPPPMTPDRKSHDKSNEKKPESSDHRH
jgi:hypothetical protein